MTTAAPAHRFGEVAAQGRHAASRVLSEVVMRRARANAVLVAMVTVALLAGLVGCADAGGCEAEVAARRAEGETARARLAVRLDALEARLLDGRARVQAWTELRERHQQVVAEASGSAAWHVADVLRARDAERLLVRAIRTPRLAAAGGADPGTRTP
jgi:hypothetical protein